MNGLERHDSKVPQEALKVITQMNGGRDLIERCSTHSILQMTSSLKQGDFDSFFFGIFLFCTITRYNKRKKYALTRGKNRLFS